MPRYSSEAYDFSLFEERTSTEERVSNARWDNAQPEEQPREEPKSALRKTWWSCPRKS